MHAGFVIFTRVRVNKRIPPFTGEGLSLFPFTGLYMLRFRLIGECQPVSPTAGKQRFDSVTQHNVLFMLCILEPPIAIPGSRCDVWTWRRKEQRLTNQAGFLCCISSVRLEHPAHNRAYIGSNPLCSTKIAADPFYICPTTECKGCNGFLRAKNSTTGSANSFPVASNRSVLNSLFPEIQRKEHRW